MTRNISRTIAAMLVGFFIFVAGINAQTSPSAADFPNIKIKNFGQMDERYFRGAQPLESDYAALKELGIQTVIDLRNDPTDYEKRAVEALGMKYVNIPMSGWRHPKESQIQEFMNLMNNPETGKVYVHCKAGIHRTGVTGAVYRFNNYGWDYDKAYEEMKNYDFSTGLVHGRLKEYVVNYAKRPRTVQPSITAAAAGGGTSN